MGLVPWGFKSPFRHIENGSAVKKISLILSYLLGISDAVFNNEPEKTNNLKKIRKKLLKNMDKLLKNYKGGNIWF